MIKDALSQGFLVREFEILQPKVILLLGNKSYKAFFKYILQIDVNSGIAKTFSKLNTQTIGKLPEFHGAVVVPFFHPSPKSGLFMSWLAESPSLSERPQIQALRNVLS